MLWYTLAYPQSNIVLETMTISAFDKYAQIQKVSSDGEEGWEGTQVQ